MKEQRSPAAGGKADGPSRLVPRPAGGPANGVSGAAREAEPKPPGFGKPGSIDPERIPRLAPHLQREAVLLLMEMGRSVLSIAHASGLGPVEIVTIAEGRHRLFDLEQPDFAEVSR